MALWSGLGQAATVAQLVGADVGGLISMTMQAALTARQNRKECEQLARRVLMVAELLPHVQEPEAATQLAGLGDTLRDAHELVISCQGRSAAYQFVMAGRQAERFREVQSKIDFYLILFPVISHIGITRRLERIYNILVQDDESTRAQLPRSSQQQTLFQIARDVVPLPHGTQEFTLADIMAATNNFSLDMLIGQGGSGRAYRGRLHDGREVVVKRMWKNIQEEFRTEVDILSRLRHQHIVRLLGSYETLAVSKKKGLLTRWRSKEEEPPEEVERLIIYEYLQNGTLFNHLHCDDHSLSELTLSWKMRIDVLLGVSRALEHLHCHAILHRDIKSANILFDANWVPRVSDFGSLFVWDIASEESLQVSRIVGTIGYFAPEYLASGRLSLACDVYSLGVLMLEVLTGRKPYSQEGDNFLPEKFGTNFPMDFLDELFAGEHSLSGIYGANFSMDYLDKRPVPEATPWHLQALKRVSWTARRCVKLDPEERLAISDIVANLELAQDLICRISDDPRSDDELPDSPRGSSVSSSGYQSDLESTEEDAGEVVPQETQELAFTEIMAATSNFSLHRMIAEGGSGKVYRGRLQDGRMVAVKRMFNMSRNLHEFYTEVDILPWLRHENIVRFIGSCETVSKNRGLLTRRGKEEPPKEVERVIVYEYLQNGTLFDYLHLNHGSPELTLSWKIRINVLVGVSRAMEYLHCHANPPIIHCDIKSANIILDANWVPHVSDFGSSVAMKSEESGLEVSSITGTVGYMAPEYLMSGLVSPACDVYSLGMVMLEVLTGKSTYSKQGENFMSELETFGSNFPMDFLDRRPVPDPTPWQLQSLTRVARTARRCVKLDPKERLAISEVVANLEMAHDLMCRISDDHGSVDESPRGSSVASAG